MTESTSPADADAALTTARSALAAARRPRPVPAWRPPVTGVLFAAGFGCLALYDAHPHTWAYLLGAALCLAIFLALTIASSRAGGITPWPAGSARERARRQSAVALPIVAGGIAWTFLGFPGFIGVFGAGLGILTWVQMASARKGTAA
ncbi:hypothetical protein ACIRRI_11235 [Streptomyces mirabilis]|uniref:hypothetical protein n=1 Tax=Streptomyces mirabilis TaxID=68239 RepID=UPI0038251A00